MDPIVSVIQTAQLSPEAQAVYMMEFLTEVESIDFKFYEKYAGKITLPSHVYGDRKASDTGAGSPGNTYSGELDSFKITGWDDLGYFMNWRATIDGKNDADYAASGALDYGYLDMEINEGEGYNNGTNYRQHDKAVTNKFYVNLPVVRFGATARYDSLSKLLIATEDNRQIVKQFGAMAAATQAQFVRATLINEATPSANVIDVSVAGWETTLVNDLNTIKRAIKKRKGKFFASEVGASDKVGTGPVRVGYIAVINSEMEDLVASLPGFKHYTEYGSQSGLLENEFGALSDSEIRFVVNDIIVRGNAGNSVITNVDSVDPTTNELVNYNMLVFAKDAYKIGGLEGAERYKLYIDAAGKGQDTLRLENPMGWKTIMTAGVTRPAYIYNVRFTNVNA